MSQDSYARHLVSCSSAKSKSSSQRSLRQTRLDVTVVALSGDDALATAAAPSCGGDSSVDGDSGGGVCAQCSRHVPAGHMQTFSRRVGSRKSVERLELCRECHALITLSRGA